MKNVVMLDTRPFQQRCYPENCLLVKPYNSDEEPESYAELCEYILFLYSKWHNLFYTLEIWLCTLKEMRTWTFGISSVLSIAR